MAQALFVSGIGTDVGKSFVSLFLVRALVADYWKPIQTGSFKDTDKVRQHLAGKVWESVYDFDEAISVHAAAQKNDIVIDIAQIVEVYHHLRKHSSSPYVVIEGAGGIYAPLSSQHRNKDLVEALQCPLLMISDYYLGSLNHTLLADAALKDIKVNKKAWIFNRYDQAPANYEHFLQQQLAYPCVATFPTTYKDKNQVVQHYDFCVSSIKTFLSDN